MVVSGDQEKGRHGPSARLGALNCYSLRVVVSRDLVNDSAREKTQGTFFHDRMHAPKHTIMASDRKVASSSQGQTLPCRSTRALCLAFVARSLARASTAPNGPCYYGRTITILRAREEKTLGTGLYHFLQGAAAAVKSPRPGFSRDGERAEVSKVTRIHAEHERDKTRHASEACKHAATDLQRRR
jgi:hypothetical protein